MIIDYLQLIKTNLKFGTRDLEIYHGRVKELSERTQYPYHPTGSIKQRNKEGARSTSFIRSESGNRAR